MADPIVFDDGGSIRIRQIPTNSAANLHGLLGDASGRHKDIAPGQFSRFVIVFLDSLGTPSASDAIPLGNGFEISCDKNQRITVTNAGGTCTIEIVPGAPGVETEVEGRQRSSQRRYTITNAGRIDTIRQGASLLFDLRSSKTANNLPSVHTSLHLLT